MSHTVALPLILPPAAQPAIAIVGALRDAGHVALLAGGCVRDLLRGESPADFDVATDATPDQLCRLFRPTRTVGASFGVVLVRKLGVWVEVATFRSDGAYLDGRRPDSVTFTTAENDARRRDFTVNGMFYDPIGAVLHDYVGGRADLEARLVRCIGKPAERFAEDYLRLLRAVRFAARLGFDMDADTLAAVRAGAARLTQIAPERIREELERMLAHATRSAAAEWLSATGLDLRLWPADIAAPLDISASRGELAHLTASAAFETAFAVLLGDRKRFELDRICRALAFSNEQREAVVFLIEQRAALDEPEGIGLAPLKRLMAQRCFPLLLQRQHARFGLLPDGADREAALQSRLAAIAPENIAPAPLVTGDDLLARGVPAGPVYKRVLDLLYTEQLEERLATREAAMLRLDELLADPA